MDTTFEAHSTLTDRFQTTVPEPVRRALKLHKRDKLQFNISATGEVRLPRMPPSEAGDPRWGRSCNFWLRTWPSAPPA